MSSRCGPRTRCAAGSRTSAPARAVRAVRVVLTSRPPFRDPGAYILGMHTEYVSTNSVAGVSRGGLAFVLCRLIRAPDERRSDVSIAVFGLSADHFFVLSRSTREPRGALLT